MHAGARHLPTTTGSCRARAGEEFTTKSGKIVNLARLDDSGRGVTWQSSFDRTGGSSGSPVFNRDFQVVAIHAAGTDTTSLEIPIGCDSPSFRIAARSDDWTCEAALRAAESRDRVSPTSRHPK